MSLKKKNQVNIKAKQAFGTKDMQILRHLLRSRAIFPVFPQLLFALMNTCNHSPENSPHTQEFLGEKEENISDFSLSISISAPSPPQISL